MKTILGIGVLGMLLFSCTTDLEKIKKISESEEGAAELGKQVEMYYTEMGQLKAKIIAPELIRFQKEPNTEFPKGLRLYFYNQHTEIESKLSANYGIFYEKKEEMLVRDDVVIINTKGEKLNTEELTWKRKEKKIYSDAFVKITTPEEIIYGTGLEANQDFSDYTIKNISGVINVEQEELP